MSSLFLSLVIIGALVVLIGVLLGQRKKIYPTLITDVALEEKIQAMLEQNQNKVAIVKLVREQTGVGLVEAKQFVDRVEFERNQ